MTDARKLKMQQAKILRQQIEIIQPILDYLKSLYKKLKESLHKRRRKKWEEDTSLEGLVFTGYRREYRQMLTSWKKILVEETPSYFTFDPRYRWCAFRALAIFLASSERVMKVSNIELFRYLEAHSNLGSVAGIRSGFYRAKRRLELTQE